MSAYIKTQKIYNLLNIKQSSTISIFPLVLFSKIITTISKIFALSFVKEINMEFLSTCKINYNRKKWKIEDMCVGLESHEMFIFVGLLSILCI